MKNAIMGVFTDTASADKAISDLMALGYSNNDISVVAKDSVRSRLTQTGGDAGDSAGKGLTTGAVLGGLAGLLVAVVAPPVGGIIFAGPIATALGISAAAGTAVAGAGVGAAAGGLLGALVGWGLSEDEARVYEEYINKEGVLVAVEARDDNTTQVKNVFTENGADEIRTGVGSGNTQVAA